MKNYTLYSIMFISFVLFLLTAFTTQIYGKLKIDEIIIQWVNENTSSLIKQMMEMLSIIGSSEVILIVTGLIAVIFLVKKDWFHLIFFLIVSVGGVFLNFILKIIFQRERPGGEVSHIDVFHVSLEIPSFSFPSGHTMRAAILFLFFIYLITRFVAHNRYKIPLFILCGLSIVGIAVSRLFLDAHFLSDTFAAINISIAWFTCSYIVLRRYDDSQNRLRQVTFGK